MGGSASKTMSTASVKSEKSRSKKLNMLLLGGPNVGKSTIFRQMKLLYQGGFDESQRKLARLQIIDNVLDSIVKVNHFTFRTTDKKFSPENIEAADRIEEMFDNFASRDVTDPSIEGLSEEDWKMVKQFIEDELFKEMFAKLTDKSRESKADSVENFALVDHGSYFVTIIDEVSDPSYLPSDAEILMLRRVTEGRDSTEFDLSVELSTKKTNNFHLKITDVGGQAHEQEDWKRVCKEEKLDTVIYVCALSEFDSVDKNGNNILKSQLSLLAKIVKSSLFEDTDLVVLMNKTDLLEEKLKHKQIQNYFKAFQKIENEASTVISHFQDELEELTKKVLVKRGMSEVGRLPLVLPTCALDTKMIERIIPRLCENALMKKMDESGLM